MLYGLVVDFLFRDFIYHESKMFQILLEILGDLFSRKRYPFAVKHLMQNLAQSCVEDSLKMRSTNFGVNRAKPARGDFSFMVFEKNRATDFIILSRSNHILFSAH